MCYVESGRHWLLLPNLQSKIWFWIIRFRKVTAKSQVSSPPQNPNPFYSLISSSKSAMKFFLLMLLNIAINCNEDTYLGKKLHWIYLSGEKIEMRMMMATIMSSRSCSCIIVIFFCCCCCCCYHYNYNFTLFSRNFLCGILIDIGPVSLPLYVWLLLRISVQMEQK